MTKALPIYLALLLFWSAPYLHANRVVNAGGGATTYTLEYEQTSNTTDQPIGDTGGRTWTATLIDDSEISTGFDVTRAGVELGIGGGTPSLNVETISVSIWSNDDAGTASDVTDDEPDTQLGISTTTIAIADISGTAWFTADFGTPVTVSSSTRYWVVLKCSDIDATNYGGWMRTTAGVAEELRSSGDSGSTWTGTSNTRGAAVRLYSSP